MPNHHIRPFLPFLSHLLFIPFSLLLFVFFSLFLSSCSDDGRFDVKGRMADGSTMNLRVIYRGDDNVNNVLTAAREGKFEFTGNAPQGTLVELTGNDYTPLARFYAEPGDEINVTVDPRDPTAAAIDGNDVNNRWTDWLHANAKTLRTRSSTKINAAVAKYAKEHPDDMLSALLLLTEYDATLGPAGARKLMQSLKREARPGYLVDDWIANVSSAMPQAEAVRLTPLTFIDRHDSLVTFNARQHRASLIVFSNEFVGRRDSILPRLHELTKVKGLQIIDLSLDTDTNTWRRSARADTVTWTSGWAAGSVTAPAVTRLAVRRLPYFIVADSTGRQQYRGPSITRAAKAAHQLTN